MHHPSVIIEPVQTLCNTLYPPLFAQTQEKYGFLARNGSLAWIWSSKEIHCYNLNNYMRNYVIVIDESEQEVQSVTEVRGPDRERNALLVCQNSTKTRRGRVRVLDALTGEQTMDIVDIPHLLTCACVLPRGGVLAAWACPVAFGTRNGDVLLVDLSQTVAGDDPIMERATHGVRSRAATPTEPPTTRRLRTLNAAEISDGRYTPRTFATAYGNDVVVCVRLVATEERRRAEHTVTYLTVLPHLLAVGFASGAWSLWSLNTLHCVHHSHAERDALPVTHMTLQRYLPDDNDDETKLTAFYLWVVRGSFAAPFLQRQGSANVAICHVQQTLPSQTQQHAVQVSVLHAALAVGTQRGTARVLLCQALDRWVAVAWEEPSSSASLATASAQKCAFERQLKVFEAPGTFGGRSERVGGDVYSLASLPSLSPLLALHIDPSSVYVFRTRRANPFRVLQQTPSPQSLNTLLHSLHKEMALDVAASPLSFTLSALTLDNALTLNYLSPPHKVLWQLCGKGASVLMPPLLDQFYALSVQTGLTAASATPPDAVLKQRALCEIVFTHHTAALLGDFVSQVKSSTSLLAALPEDILTESKYVVANPRVFLDWIWDDVYSVLAHAAHTLIDSAWMSRVRATEKELLLRILCDMETQLVAVRRVLAQLMTRDDVTREGLHALHERFFRVDALTRYILVTRWFLSAGFMDQSPPAAVAATPRASAPVSDWNASYERLNAECAMRRKRREQQHNSHRWEVDAHMRGTLVSDPPDVAGRLSVDLILHSLSLSSSASSPSEHSPRYPHATLATFLRTLYTATPLPAVSATALDSDLSSSLYCLTFYLLIDLSSIMQMSVEQVRSLAESFANHVHLPRAEQRRVHILWLIDTERYSDALASLRDPLAASQLLNTPWAEYVLQILVDAEKWPEALTLLTLHNHLHCHDFRSTPTRSQSYNDAILHVRILLHNRLFLPAFTLIRELTRTSPESIDEPLLATLLWHLFHFVRCENQWATLFALPLDSVEETHLLQYLTAHIQEPDVTPAWECLVAYYLQRGRLMEAVTLHRQLLAAQGDSEAAALRAALLDNFVLLLPSVERPPFVSSGSPVTADLNVSPPRVSVPEIGAARKQSQSAATPTLKHVSRLFSKTAEFQTESPRVRGGAMTSRPSSPLLLPAERARPSVTRLPVVTPTNAVRPAPSAIRSGRAFIGSFGTIRSAAVSSSSDENFLTSSLSPFTPTSRNSLAPPLKAETPQQPETVSDSNSLSSPAATFSLVSSTEARTSALPAGTKLPAERVEETEPKHTIRDTANSISVSATLPSDRSSVSTTARLANTFLTDGTDEQRESSVLPQSQVTTVSPTENTQADESVHALKIPAATVSTSSASLPATPSDDTSNASQTQSQEEEKTERLAQKQMETPIGKGKVVEESHSARRSSRLAQTPKPTYNEKVLIERTRKKATLNTKQGKKSSVNDTATDWEGVASASNTPPQSTSTPQTANLSASKVSSSSRPALKHHPFALRTARRTQKKANK